MSSELTWFNDINKLHSFFIALLFKILFSTPSRRVIKCPAFAF